MSQEDSVGWECYAELRLLGLAESPEETSARLGIQPTKHWRAGDALCAHNGTRKENGWVLRSQLATDAEPAEHVGWLFRQLKDGVGRLTCDDGIATATVSCVLFLESGTPPMFFDASVVRRIAELGASLDVDIYLTREADELS